MKQYFKHYAFIFLSLFIFGCTQKVINPGNIVIANSSFDMISQSYDQMKSSIIKQWNMFSLEDQKKLLTIDDNVERIKASILVIKLKNYQDVSITEMGYIYTLAVQSYTIATEILNSNKDKLSDHEQLTIALMSDQLKLLDTKVQTMLKNPDPEKTKELITNITLVIGTGLKAIIPLLLI